MCVSVLLAYISVHMCVPGACGAQKRVLDALELDLQAVMSQHVGVGNQTLVLRKSKKSNQCS